MLDLAGRADGQDLAEVEHVHRAAHPKHQVDVVFDQHHREAFRGQLPQQAGERVGLRLGLPRCGFIEQEDPRKPLSDSKIVSILQREGLELARRTIAKYREELKIPTSNQRKVLY